MALEVKANHEKEIINDVPNADHKIIIVISEYKTSDYKFMAYIVCRTNNDIVIKKDVVMILKCVELQ